MCFTLNALGVKWHLPDKEEFGKLLRNLREDRGLSVRAMANRFELHPSAMTQTELGRYKGLAWDIVEAYAGLGALSRDSLLEVIEAIGIGLRLPRGKVVIPPPIYAPFFSKPQKVRIHKMASALKARLPEAYHQVEEGGKYVPSKVMPSMPGRKKPRRKVSKPRVWLKVLTETSGGTTEEVATLTVGGHEFDLDVALGRELESVVQSYLGRQSGYK